MLLPISTLDPQHLPPLPTRGLARDTKAGVELETMRGRPLGLLRGLNLSHRLGLQGAPAAGPDCSTVHDRSLRAARTARLSDGPTRPARMHVHRCRCPCSAVRLWPLNRVPCARASADRGEGARKGGALAVGRSVVGRESGSCAVVCRVRDSCRIPRRRRRDAPLRRADDSGRAGVGRAGLAAEPKRGRSFPERRLR